MGANVDVSIQTDCSKQSEGWAATPYLLFYPDCNRKNIYNTRVGRGTKTEQIKLPLATTDHSAADIADICGCSYQLVTKIRRELKLPYANQTAARRMARLEEDVRELRSTIRKLLAVTGTNAQGVARA